LKKQEEKKKETEKKDLLSTIPLQQNDSIYYASTNAQQTGFCLVCMH
jgi:hypothetical protein